MRKEREETVVGHTEQIRKYLGKLEEPRVKADPVLYEALHDVINFHLDRIGLLIDKRFPER